MNIGSLIKQTFLGTAPHMGEPNLKLFCLKPTGQFNFDSVGNKRPVYQEIIIELSVREDKLARNQVPPDGATIKGQSLLGRFVNPKLAPNWLSCKQRYKAELIDIATKLVIEGEFEFDVLVQHRIPEFNDARGSFAKGLFVEIK